MTGLIPQNLELLSCGIRLSRPVVPPLLEEFQLRFGKVHLTGREPIGFIEVQFVVRVAEQHEQILVVQHQVRPFVETGQLGESIFQFSRQSPGFDVTGSGPFAKRDQVQHFAGQAVADPGDRADRATANESMTHLRIDADHQQDVAVGMSDVLGGVAQRIRAAEFLEADEIRKLAPQIEEQVTLVSNP